MDSVNKRVSPAPPSKAALLAAYELVLGKIVPRISSIPQPTGRRRNDEDSAHPKRADYPSGRN
ncbi:hypothetical protein ACAF76_003535 [Brevibacillus sp. TJ4]|uniref:hypothetical protein n=1 Tax=Brevibacillus sp. TJ4 TaxID=3234853 RepID=UPI003BA35AEB